PVRRPEAPRSSTPCGERRAGARQRRGSPREFHTGCPSRSHTRSMRTMTVTDERFHKMQPLPGNVNHLAARELPPGPRWPSLLQSIALVRFRHQFVPAMHKRYGDVFTVRVMPKGSALVLFTRPEHAKEIFAGDPEVFHAGKGNA